MRKDHLNVHVFQDRNWCSTKSDRWLFFLTLAVRGYFRKGRKLYMQNLTKARKQPPVVILQKLNYYNIFIRCFWLRIIRSPIKVYLVYEFTFTDVFNDINHGYRAAILKKSSLWLLPFYMAVAIYCYYKNVRRTIPIAIVSYLLKKEFLLFNSCCYFCFQIRLYGWIT